MEEHPREPVATGNGGRGTDDTKMIQRVEPSSFITAGDRLLVHLNSSDSTACPGDTQATTN